MSKDGIVISRIEVSFYSPKVFKSSVYKDIIFGKIFTISNTPGSLIDNCCLPIKTEEKHRIIFEGEKECGRIIYIN